LDHERKDQDDEEISVVGQAREDVEFSWSKLLGVDQVEKLHEHEGLENHCVKLHFVTNWFTHAFFVSGRIEDFSFTNAEFFSRVEGISILELETEPVLKEE